MTEEEWMGCKDPRQMMNFLRTKRGASRTKQGKRRLRLFACACLRGIWPLVRQTGSRAAVDVAERYADGLASETELASAALRARQANGHESLQEHRPYWQAAEAAGHACVKQFDGGDHHSVAHASYSAACAWAIDRVRAVAARNEELMARQAVHANWLRDTFGNPFRPVTFLPAWRTGTAVAIARRMYELRDFSAMPILADALQDAGCDSDDVLNHCREPSEHVRGCWVVDHVLGKS